MRKITRIIALLAMTVAGLTLLGSGVREARAWDWPPDPINYESSSPSQEQPSPNSPPWGGAVLSPRSC
jgi:hypothetical protein